MQLILSNADLTAAITAYLGSVVTVNETATVQVELTEDGAVVEITPAGQTAPVKEPRVVKTRGPRKAAVTDGKLTVSGGAVVETPVVEKQDPVAPAAEPETPVVEQQTASPGVTTGAGNVSDPLPGDADAQPEVQQEAEPRLTDPAEQKPVNKATSLFAGLNRPKN